MGLDYVELVMDLESEFNIRLSENLVSEIRTVGQLFDVMRPLVASEGPINYSGYSGPLWERYLTVVARTLGVERKQLRPDADFVNDLGAG